MRRNNLSAPEAYARVVQSIDAANYIDYKCCEIFSYRWDMNQYRFWRPHTAGGRWRWLSFDGDVAWGGFWSQAPAWQFNMLAADLAKDGSLNGHNTDMSTLMLRRLMRNPEFRRDFINRFQDLLNTTFRPSNTLARIDQLASVLAPEMEEHIRRWRAPGSLAEWQRNVDALRTYARERPQYAREQLRKQFDLGSPGTVAVNLKPPDGGTVRLNTHLICSGQTDTWSGVYFKGHPITLEARPSSGFQFDGWAGSTNCASSLMILSLQSDCDLTARFVQSAGTKQD